MRNLRARSASTDLATRLEAVGTLAELGEGRADPGSVAAARRIVEKADERVAAGMGFTVVALAGATGSGKSSLFNALVGSAVSEVGVRRPTTARTSAAVWGGDPADALLDWLQVERRHRVPAEASQGLVLLDLPDHDSTEAAHRDEVDRLVELVDLFIWVVDPQKYADAVLHDDYLRPLAEHAVVTLVVMNQSDRLSSAELDRCAGDLRRLLTEDGLRGAQVLTASAVTGAGVDDIRDAVARRVEEKRSASQRLLADVEQIAERFELYCRGGTAAEVPRRERHRLLSALTDAAGAHTVAEAARRSYGREAGLATGWAVTRWVRRLRPDPLARLHLGKEAGGRTSSKPVADLARARVESAQREVANEVSRGLPEPWPRLLRARAGDATDPLLQDMDRAIGRADVRPKRSPRWWTLGSMLQKVLLLLVIAGFVWLGVLFGLEWFQIPDPPTPEVRGIPWPTLLFFGGLLAGFASAVLFGLFARVGAARVKKRALASMEHELRSVVEERVIAPVEEELEIFTMLCRAVAKARG